MDLTSPHVVVMDVMEMSNFEHDHRPHFHSTNKQTNKNEYLRREWITIQQRSFIYILKMIYDE